MTMLIRNKIKLVLVHILSRAEQWIQLLFFKSKVSYNSYEAPMLNRHVPRLFNLDLHISVIRDLKYGFRNSKVDITSWSISGANAQIRRFLRFSDPVKYINRKNWQNLNLDLITNFQNEYHNFLKKFDGFIVTYPPTFAELFLKYEKPILVDIPIRYETPYSGDTESWNRINGKFIDKYKEGIITFWANNQGDVDYFNYHTGIQPFLVPSKCDYLQAKWCKTRFIKKVVFAKDVDLVKEIGKATNGTWKSSKEVLGARYNWSDVMDSTYIFYIPYHNSTMQLFELATAGVPVVVPSKNFLKKLFFKGFNVLGELTWFQIYNLETSLLNSNNPNNFKSDKFLDWWLARCDFYDLELMPNVYIVENFDELNTITLKIDVDILKNQVEIRNSKLDDLRNAYFNDYVSKL